MADEPTKQDKQEARAAAKEQAADERDFAKEQAQQEKEALAAAPPTQDDQFVVLDEWSQGEQIQRERDRVADEAFAQRASQPPETGPAQPTTGEETS